MTEPTAAEVLTRAQGVFRKNNAVSLATAGAPGGEYSPWVLGAYFAHEGPDLYLFLETHGKSFKNVRENPRVAFSVSENDASRDFVQGRGVLEVLDAAAYDAVMARLVAKMPWFKLYTPSTPVRVVSRELLVSSLESQWFPAKKWAR